VQSLWPCVLTTTTTSLALGRSSDLFVKLEPRPRSCVRVCVVDVMSFTLDQAPASHTHVSVAVHVNKLECK
jgi:hypothetical protein